MAHFTSLALRLLALFALLPSLTLSAPSSPPSPVLSTPMTLECLKGSKHEGTPTGKNITIADVATYLAEPPNANTTHPKVIFYYPDAYGPFFINGMLMQDYLAQQGESFVSFPTPVSLGVWYSGG